MKLKKIMPLILVFLSVGFTFVILEIIFRFLPVRDALKRDMMTQTIPHHAANRDVEVSKGWNFSLHQKKHINNYGFVNDQDYDTNQHNPLLAVIGDSYVEALQVTHQESINGILSQSVGPSRRVYSFGVSGAPLSTYLAFADFARKNFKPDRMIFVIIANDFDESLPDYKTNSAVGFSYFSRDSRRLEFIRSDQLASYQGLRDFAAQSSFLRYLFLNLNLKYFLQNTLLEGTAKQFVANTSSSIDAKRMKDSKWVVDRFFEQLPSYSGLSKQQVLFVVDGIRPQLYDQKKLHQVQNSYFAQMRNYFMQTANQLSYEVIDMQPVFIDEYQQHAKPYEFVNDNHWNAWSHQVVADQVQKSVLYQNFLKQAKD